MKKYIVTEAYFSRVHRHEANTKVSLRKANSFHELIIDLLELDIIKDHFALFQHHDDLSIKEDEYRSLVPLLPMQRLIDHFNECNSMSETFFTIHELNEYGTLTPIITEI